MTTVASAVARTRPLPLNFHKIVEERRRSRIDRSRQLSMNVELQRSILYTTELYNLEPERQRLKVALQTSLGAPLARVVHNAQMAGVVMRTREDDERDARRKAVEERLANMTNRVAELEGAMTIGGGGSIPARQRMRKKDPVVTAPPNMTLDQFGLDAVRKNALNRKTTS